MVNREIIQTLNVFYNCQYIMTKRSRQKFLRTTFSSTTSSNCCVRICKHLYKSRQKCSARPIKPVKTDN